MARGKPLTGKVSMMVGDKKITYLEVDENGDRPEEIVGFVRGYAEDKLVIGEHVIALDDLRCVLLLSD